MNILITSGGTSEPIDGVRTITNISTGRIGSLIADVFANYSDVDNIYYVCGKNSLLPKNEKAKIIKIGNTAELQETITELLTKNKIDAVIHSMAVSDYTVSSVTSTKSIADEIEANIQALTTCKNNLNGVIKEVIQNAKSVKSSGKINSEIDDLVLVLKRTPKIISLIKKLSPNAVLVGFKLLNGVSTVVLIDTAYKLLVKNRCDYVLANDLADINGEKQVGYLINKGKFIDRFVSKNEIAIGIATTVMNKLREEI